MIDDLKSLARKLARKHYSRWNRFDDALALLRAVDDGGRSKEGERSRRMLVNARRVGHYPDKELEVLLTDRANITHKLAEPLAIALGHLVTLDLIEDRVADIKRVQKERTSQQSELDRDGYYREHRPLIDALFEKGIAHGHYSVLTDAEMAAIAGYIRRKVEQRVEGLPPLRKKAANGKRQHPFWDGFSLPVVPAKKTMT